MFAMPCGNILPRKRSGTFCRGSYFAPFIDESEALLHQGKFIPQKVTVTSRAMRESGARHRCQPAAVTGGSKQQEVAPRGDPSSNS